MTLLIRYKLDEGTGTSAYDDVYGNNILTLTNGRWQNNTDGSGNPYMSRYFDGTAYGTPASNTPFVFERTDTFSVVVWVRSPPNTATRTIIGKQQSGITTAGWVFTIGDRGGVRVHICNVYPSDAIAKYDNKRVDDDFWHHVGFTYDGSSDASGVKFYVDGIQDTDVTVVANTLTSSIANTGNATIGRLSGGNSPFYGYIYDFRLYNEVLTSANMLDLYNTTKNAAGIGGGTGDTFVIRDIVGYDSDLSVYCL